MIYADKLSLIKMTLYMPNRAHAFIVLFKFSVAFMSQKLKLWAKHLGRKVHINYAII